MGREGYGSLRFGKRAIEVPFLNEHVAEKPTGKPRNLRRKTLVRKNLPNEFARLFEIGGRIIADKSVGTDHVVPAELHAEQRRAGKPRKPLSPNLARPFDALLGVFHELFVATKVKVVLFERGGILSPGVAVLGLLQHTPLPRQRSHDHSSDLVLQRPGVAARPVEPLRPNMLASLCVDELRDNPKLVVVLANAAFEHIIDAQLSSDLPHVHDLAWVGKGRA